MDCCWVHIELTKHMNKMCYCDNQNSQKKYCSGVAPKLNAIKSGGKNGQNSGSDSSELWHQHSSRSEQVLDRMIQDWHIKLKIWTLGPGTVYTVYIGTDPEFSSTIKYYGTHNSRANMQGAVVF